MLLLLLLLLSLLMLLLWERVFCTHRCARWGLLHVKVKNFLRYHAKPILPLWQW